MARLAGRVALITGAGTGIGRATARAMAVAGAKIVVAEITLEAGVPRMVKVAEAPRVGLIEPEGIASMAVFLASDESRKITLHVYPVDSGMTIS